MTQQVHLDIQPKELKAGCKWVYHIDVQSSTICHSQKVGGKTKCPQQMNR